MADKRARSTIFQPFAGRQERRKEGESFIKTTDGNIRIDWDSASAPQSGAGVVHVAVGALEHAAKAMSKVAKAQEQLVKTTQATAKNAKGALAGFDELNILVQKKASSAGKPSGAPKDDKLTEIGKGSWGGLGSQLHMPVLAAGDPGLWDAAMTTKAQWEELVQSLWESWRVNAALLTGNLPLLFTEITSLLQSGWGHNIAPALEGASAALSQWLSNTVKPCFEAILAGLEALVKEAPVILSEFIRPLADGFENVFLPAVRSSSQTAADVFAALGLTLGQILDGMMLSFTGLGEFLLGVFTADWGRAWQGILDLFRGKWDAMTAVTKGAANLIISLINGMIRAAVSGINFLIRQMNKIHFDVPDWVPGIGGMSFGVHLDTLEPYQIPFLAKGAVIPPGAQFLAMLGDQKNGRNLEAPEGLIRQIVREESGSRGVNLTVSAKGTAGEFVRWLSFELEQEELRRGTSLLKGGNRFC